MHQLFQCPRATAEKNSFPLWGPLSLETMKLSWLRLVHARYDLIKSSWCLKVWNFISQVSCWQTFVSVSWIVLLPRVPSFSRLRIHLMVPPVSYWYLVNILRLYCIGSCRWIHRGLHSWRGSFSLGLPGLFPGSLRVRVPAFLTSAPKKMSQS